MNFLAVSARRYGALVVAIVTQRHGWYVPNFCADGTHIAVEAKSINDDLTDRVLQEIKKLPTPSLVHCKSGMRAGAMTMMHLALENGWDAKQALQQAENRGFDYSQNPQLKQYFESYIDKRNRKN